MTFNRKHDRMKNLKMHPLARAIKLEIALMQYEAQA